MNLKEFGESLKKRREAKALSLMDIASETRISITFLEAMEAGRFPTLPPTYIRAFLREYARMIEIDPEGLVQEYAAVLEGPREEKAKEPARTTSPGPQAPVPQLQLQPQQPPRAENAKYLNQRNLFFAAFLLLLVLFVWYITRSVRTAPATEETPFASVLAEQQSAATPPSDSTTPPAAAPVQQRDSLRLQIFTHDTVWVYITIDTRPSEQYLLPPNRTRSWTAKDKFALTLGNAGGARFTLNGKDIGMLGRRGSVVRNEIVNWATLEKH